MNSHAVTEKVLYSVRIEAKNKFERTKIMNLGIALDGIGENYVESVITKEELHNLKEISSPFEILNLDSFTLDFPPKDARYHNYQELIDALKGLHEEYPELTELKSIGKSVNGTDIWVLKIGSQEENLKPGIVFMGGHHAREHLSIEVPFYLATYLLSQSQTPKIKTLLESRDIWIIPVVNPDGTEYDIENGKYKLWRKNRTHNEDGSFGVDLNRNYGYQWGREGSSQFPRSETYRGPEAFSEPETRTIRDFVISHPHIKVLISYHTFSELILYPWGYTYDSIQNQTDLSIFENMAGAMSKMTGYKAEQSSDLYLVSGDTTDWAYGERGIYAFTFELSPKSMGGGGFYPGDIIDKTVDDNIEAALYAIERAGHVGLSLYLH